MQYASRYHAKAVGTPKIFFVEEVTNENKIMF